MGDRYCITFRIADQTVNGKTYDDRYSSVEENARTKGMGYWEETTSFILAESNLNTPDFTKKVASGLSEKHDTLVVFDPTDMSASYFGKVEAVDVLRSFFPKLKKVP